MSDPSRPKASLASAVLSAIMILIGLVLLLPGVCAGYFWVVTSRLDPASLRWDANTPNFFAPFITLGFAVSAGGVVLIILAVRLLRSSRNRRP